MCVLSMCCFVSHACRFQEPFLVDIELLDPDATGTRTVPYPMLLPHEVVAALHAAGHSAFEQRLGAQHKISEYWQFLSGIPAYRLHPGFGVSYPSGFHGDAAQVFQDRKVLQLTWSSILARGPTLDTRFPIAMLPCDLMLDNNRTIKPILQAVAWSFRVLSDGVLPELDMFGRPLGRRASAFGQPGQSLAGGLTFSLVEYRGDWEWHYQHWQLTNFWTTFEICHCCKAALAGEMVYSDFREGAPHVQARRTTREFVMARPDHPMLSLPFALCYIRHCAMHVCNLGIGRLLSASVILDLASAGMFGPGPMKTQLEVATADLRSWARQCKTKTRRPPRFTKKRLGIGKKGQYPILTTKAWSSRIISGWVADVAHAAAVAHPESGVAAVRAVAVHSFAELYSVMEQHGRFLSESQREEARAARISTAPMCTTQLLFVVSLRMALCLGLGCCRSTSWACAFSTLTPSLLGLHCNRGPTTTA